MTQGIKRPSGAVSYLGAVIVLAILVIIAGAAWYYIGSQTPASKTGTPGTNLETNPFEIPATGTIPGVNPVPTTTPGVTPTTTPAGTSTTTSQINAANRLDLSNKNLTQISQGVFDQANLEELIVDNNQLTGAAPAEIRKLVNLRVLSFRNNKMTGIPAEIGQLSKLEALDYSFNQIDTMPNEIANLANLRALFLANNKYREIPASLLDLATLRVLDFSNNQLTRLPADLSKLSKLTILKVSGNNLVAGELSRIKTALPNTQVID